MMEELRHHQLENYMTKRQSVAKKKATVKTKTTGKTKTAQVRKRKESKPSAASLARKNDLKRSQYAKGEYTVCSIYLTKDQIEMLKVKADSSGNKRSLLVREAIDMAYGTKKGVDKNTRSAQVRDKKTVSAKKKETKNVARKTRKPAE